MAFALCYEQIEARTFRNGKQFLPLYVVLVVLLWIDVQKVAAVCPTAAGAFKIFQ